MLLAPVLIQPVARVAFLAPELILALPAELFQEWAKVGVFEKFWKNGTPVQYCGKDNLRQQSAMWQAMLFAAGLPNSHQIVIDGFVTGEGGIKMTSQMVDTQKRFMVQPR